MADVLFVVFDSAAPAADETSIKGWLEGDGHTVTLLSGTAAEADAADYDAALISTRVGPAALSTKYRDWTKHVVLITINSTNAQNLNFLSTSATLVTVDNTQLEIVNSAHDLANGLSNGLHTIVATAEGMAGEDNGDFGSGAALIAARGDNSVKYTFVGYLSGAAMANSFTAPARRVWIGWRSDMQGAINATGQGLLLNAVSWGIPAGGGSTVAATLTDSFSFGESLDATESGDVDPTFVAFDDSISLRFNLTREPVDVVNTFTDRLTWTRNSIAPAGSGSEGGLEPWNAERERRLRRRSAVRV